MTEAEALKHLLIAMNESGDWPLLTSAEKRLVLKSIINAVADLAMVSGNMSIFTEPES